MPGLESAPPTAAEGRPPASFSAGLTPRDAGEPRPDRLSRLSHAMRTPLNAILGFGQLLEIDQLGGAQRESVEHIISAGRHLLRLVNESLDGGQPETGPLSEEAWHPLADPGALAVVPAAAAGEAGSHPVITPEAASPGLLPAPKAPGAQTILHIEDNEPNRRLMELLLVQRPGLRLLAADRGAEGLELARTHQPDLILLDMHLPDMPGERVLQALRAEAQTSATPVIVISADATTARQQNLRGLGANDYLTKPFNVKQFLRMLDVYLHQAGPTAATARP